MMIAAWLRETALGCRAPKTGVVDVAVSAVRGSAVQRLIGLGSTRLVAALASFVLAPAMANGLHTAHQFAVSEGGAATVTVPIQVPRGIGGMEPQLALNYSSGSGNGLLGLGWSLSGPSAISRCPKTRAIDNERGVVKFSTGDRYCLDGQRLVIIGQASTDALYGTANSQYRTERDSFSRITAIGTYAAQSTVPSSFRVETKAGLLLEFGLSANSQVMTNFVAGVSTPATINRWMLQRISDRHGSFVEFFYCGGEVTVDGSTCNSAAWSGSKVLHYIRYTNRAGAINGEFAVVFGYEARPDRVQGFHAGSASRQTQRLSRIETYRDFTGPNGSGVLPLTSFKLVRGYNITYDPIVNASGASLRANNTSRIIQILERDSAGNTLAPLTFKLPPDLVFDQAVTQNATATGRVPPPTVACGGALGSGGSICQ